MPHLFFLIHWPCFYLGNELEVFFLHSGVIRPVGGVEVAVAGHGRDGLLQV